MSRSIEELAAEILRLRNSAYVKLARQEETLRCALLEELQFLRKQEARGKEIASSSATMELIARVGANADFDLW